MSDGTFWSITILYDADGDETDELEEAVAFSVEAIEGWFAGRFDWFVRAPVQ